MVRRTSVKAAVLTSAVLLLLATGAGCGGEQIVEKVVKETVVVRQEVPVEKVVKETVERVVKETVVVKQEVPVEKIVKETVVVKERVPVEKLVVATPTIGPSPTPAPQAGGTLRVAVTSVTPGSFLPRNIIFPHNRSIIGWGLVEGLIQASFAPSPRAGEPTNLGIAKSWQVASDLKSVTFSIRSGVPFHRGWGDVTAHDVAWTYNDALQPDSKAKVKDTTWIGEWTVLDDSTVKVSNRQANATLPGTWMSSLMSPYGADGMVFSKKVFDKLGPEGANVTPVGTGPFEVERWLANEEVILRAVKPHWFRTPSVDKVIIREIPELSTRIAAFRTGEVHIAPMPLKDIRDAVNATKGYAVEPQPGSMRNFHFGGNYWLKTDPQTGKTIEPRPGLVQGLKEGKPWIGDPDNPESMERARKVRLAMNLALDRNLLNESMTAGFGKTKCPTLFGFECDDPLYKKAWGRNWEFDLPAAKQLLKDAGYPSGFKVKVYVAPDQAAIVPFELGEATVQMWRDNLGLDTQIDSTAYAAMRPNLVARTHNDLFMWRAIYAEGGPSQPQGGYISTTGFTVGIELPCTAEVWKRVRFEPDLQKVRLASAEQEDCLAQTSVYSPILITPGLTAVRPEVDWDPPRAGTPEGGSFDYAVLKK